MATEKVLIFCVPLPIFTKVVYNSENVAMESVKWKVENNSDFTLSIFPLKRSFL